MRTDISFCMINRNSADTLQDCLESVSHLADEIIVVDTGSMDNSPDIARSFGAQVLFAPWTNDFSAARNRYLQAAQCAWILSLDSDEVLNPCGKAELANILQRFPQTAFKLNIRNYYTLRDFEQELVPEKTNSEILPGVGVRLSSTIRLFPNHPDIRYCYPIHESLIPSLRRLNMKIRILSVPIHHFGFLSQRAKIGSKLEVYKALGLKKIARFPRFYLGYFELGKILLHERRFKDAERMFIACLRLKPDYAAGHFQLALTLYKQKRLDACRRQAEQALARFPKHLDLIYLLGLVDAQSGRHKSAADRFSAVLRARSTHYASYIHAANAYLASETYSKAEDVLSQALTASPWREDAFLLLARVAEIQGDRARAIEILRRGQASVSQPAQLPLYLAILEQLSDRLVDDEAISDT